VSDGHKSGSCVVLHNWLNSVNGCDVGMGSNNPWIDRSGSASRVGWIFGRRLSCAVLGSPVISL
jgi:hypothetical protein